MIDFIDIRFQGDDFGVVGKQLRTTQPSGHKTQSFTPTKVQATRLAPFINLHLQVKNQCLRIWGSPLWWLQGQNGMGSNDLHFLTVETVALAFAHLQRPVPQSVAAQLANRTYSVAEVHVAELHRMPHALIFAFCENIRRLAPTALHATPLERGIGIKLWAGSRERQVLLYDKRNYFLDGMQRHRRKLLGQLPMRAFERLGPSLMFDRMMEEHLNQGIRIETRHQRNLKTHGLDIGSAWSETSARDLHHRVLETVPLADLPPVSEAEALLAGSSQDDRRLLALWLDHRPLPAFFDGSSTYFTWRKRILRNKGLDLSTAPIPSAETTWSQLISREAALDTPEWALEGGFLHDPRRPTAPFVKSPGERAWPPATSSSSQPETAGLKSGRR